MLTEGKLTLSISDSDVPSGTILARLTRLKGVIKITPNHLMNTLTIEYDPDRITDEQIRSFVKKQQR